MLLPFWGIIFISLLEAGGCLAIVILQYYGFTKFFISVSEKQPSNLYFFYQSLIYASIIVLTGFLCAYFAEIYKKKNQNLSRALAELQDTQARLIQSEKLASIGVLSSGITHELKNPITSIYGFAELAMKQMEKQPLSPELTELIQEIYLNSRHCKGIITGLLDFSRTSTKGEVFEKINLVRVLADALRIIKHQLDIQNITVSESFSVQEILAPGNATQLQQVFLNILINARDAMPNGGEISINIKINGPEVDISFKDTGTGMPPEILARVLEPFFTTKAAGQGIGLGLSVSYGIILRHGGRINISSQPRQGTTIVVTLPLEQKIAKKDK
jgi:signal transduction histidine kinase